jgi:hypothetical protein
MRKMSGWTAVLTVVSSLAIAANAFAAPIVEPILQHQLALDTSVELGRGLISLIPLENQDRTIVAIAATFDVSKYCTATSVIVSAHINGFAVAPPFPAFVENHGDGCSATGVFRVDLDAAELVHPGAFIGQPLNVTLTYWG